MSKRGIEIIRWILILVAIAWLTRVTSDPANAARPQQYERWADYKFVVAADEVPEKLGAPPDKIEWVRGYTFRVTGGKCRVLVNLLLADPKAARPAGGRPTVRAVVGHRVCK